MSHDRTYRPVPYVPAPRLRDADGSMRPHTSGVRVCSCAAIATEPCRPTACAGEHPNPSAYTPTAHYSLLTAHSSYTFSAKEKDTETGLSYFGSRYYSSDLSIWLSVDPMAAKYPSLSPYTYCADNPVKLVDPNGEEVGNPPLHHRFLITIGIQIYEAAKKKGSTPNGAILVLAHACRESGWGQSAIENGDYNLFGIMGKPSKRPTSHGSVKDYSNLGGYEASINDYFNRTDQNWPKWKKVLAQDHFTSDDIDRAFNTGSYFPSEDDQKNGIYAYCGNRDANGKSNYGEDLMKQFVSTKKRFIQSLEYQINKNEEMIRQGIPYSTQYLNRLEKDNERYNAILNEIR